MKSQSKSGSNPSELPAIALKNVVLFPRIIIPLVVQRPKSIAALLDAQAQNDGMAVFVTQKLFNQEVSDEVRLDQLYKTATIGKILRVTNMRDGSKSIDVEGISRVKIKEFTQTDPYIKAKVETINLKMPIHTAELEGLMRSIVELFKHIMAEIGRPLPTDLYVLLRQVKDPDQLIDLVIVNLGISTNEQQELLEMANIDDALKKVHQILMREREVIDAEKKVSLETHKRLNKMQREAFLREQMKTIEQELGIENEKGEIEMYRKKIEDANMPSEVKSKALKELGRLEKMPSFAPEVSYIRTYLDWFVELPWSKKTGSQIDISKAQIILDEDHFGLEKAKERILEYLAVQKNVGKMRGPILCFVGPPGTGKTSIGKSIARALGRKFHRISLGGIRDEAEIRGHRRTYVGAMPGRIIQGINVVGTNNPVFMLDEIDKIGIDFRGDPSSALLEALDPEQNSNFSDHYLEVPFDLSNVMFITTANMLDTIPYALRDRLEIIEFRGYTEDENLHIANKFLIPKLKIEHGMKQDVEIEEEALRDVIRKYTIEAGVRDLERQLAKIFRKIVRVFIENGSKKQKLTKIALKDLKKFLGPEKYLQQLSEKMDQVGIATGLAWTPVGGQVMSIEAMKMPGRGKLNLTGRLGKTMQESAMAALSYARAQAAKLGAKVDFYKYDFHLHVPSGGIPKDGPSAGIAMATALVSLLLGLKIHKEIAMTGEVTLRGKVLEIGGLKEKVLAAHRAGLKTVIIPKDNERDLEDIPKEIRSELKFKIVENMDEVLDEALKWPASRTTITSISRRAIASVRPASPEA